MKYLHSNEIFLEYNLSKSPDRLIVSIGIIRSFQNCNKIVRVVDHSFDICLLRSELFGYLKHVPK